MNPWNATEASFDASTFSGTARLFPLPNLVLFPHIVQPLHVFEERYREMIQDALADDRLIAMAMLEPGWEPEYEGRPPIVPYACLGKIVTHHRLEDGRYNLLLMGVHRVRIAEELAPKRSFRQARVELIEDRVSETSTERLSQLRDELVTLFRKCVPCSCQPPEQLQEMLAQQLPLELLTDLAAYTVPLELSVKQQLLAECRVDVRARLLSQELRQLVSGASGTQATPVGIDFPPSFSVN